MNKLIVPTLTLLLNFSALAAPSLVEVNGCLPSDYESVLEGEVKISVQNFQFTPRCLKVRPGTRITIEGSTMHPLQGNDDINGIANPFRKERASVSDETQVLTETGQYGYFCTRHGSMKGSILVAE